MGKYYQKYLPETYWTLYQQIYSNANYQNMWVSVFRSCDLFRELATDVATTLSYPVDDDRNMTSYLKQVSQLPRTDKAIF